MKVNATLARRTIFILCLLTGLSSPLFGQEKTFGNDYAIPAKLYMLSDTPNNLFIEPIIKRWRPYNDLIRFSGNGTTIRNRERFASIENPADGATMEISLINTDHFETIKKDSVQLCVGKSRQGTGTVTIQILGDSFVNGAFFRDALLTKGYVPGAKLIGLRNIKDEEDQYDEGRGGWTMQKYFEIPKGEFTSYHGYMQPPGKYRYWGSCEFWKNCHKVANKELTNTETVYSCGRYNKAMQRFNPKTGYLLAPQKNDLMFDNTRQSYIVYNGKAWIPTTVNEEEWRFDYAKYLSMWNLEAPLFLGQMLGLNDFRYEITTQFEAWNKRMEEMKNAYYAAVPNGKFMILIPCSTCGTINNARGDFTLQQNAAMWQLRKNIIDTFDNREQEGYYLVDIGITIDNEKGYLQDKEGLQTGNPHPYPNYPAMGMPIAGFIQYYRK